MHDIIKKFLEAPKEQIDPEHLRYFIDHLKPQSFINYKQFDQARTKLQNKLNEVRKFHNLTKTKTQEERQQQNNAQLQKSLKEQIASKSIKIAYSNGNPIKLNGDGTFTATTGLGYTKTFSLLSLLNQHQLCGILGSQPSQHHVIQTTIPDRTERMKELKQIGFASNEQQRHRKHVLTQGAVTQIHIMKV